MTLYGWVLAPFVDFGFMRRALVACLALGLGSGPVGVLLLLRRMSLVGDAMSHAVLPGAAVGFLFAGLSLPAMGLGGLVAGLAVALLSGLIGLVVSFHLGVASGPAIVLTASGFYAASLLFAPTGAVRRLFPRPHLAG